MQKRPMDSSHHRCRTIFTKKLYICSVSTLLCTLNFAMYRESVSTFADLSVTLEAAPRHVQRVRFSAPEISRLFGDTVEASLVRIN